VPDPWFDASRLTPASDPITLPGFTLPGDETSSLMLPVAPEISRLPEAFAAAARRFTERPPAIITYVDPLTGKADDDAAPTAGDQSWRLVDASRDDLEPDGTGLEGDPGVMPSRIAGARIPGARILWDSHPP
jgi:hypothetical protein